MIRRFLFGGSEDFPGGVHPPQRKRHSNQVAIVAGPLPKRLVLPLNMHQGTPARPLVAPGQRVLKGQCIAAPVGAVSAAVHASTSGTVGVVGPMPVQHPSGLDAPCIVIESDGEDRWAERPATADYRALTPTELEQRLRQAGLAGLGGAGFPSAAKPHRAPGRRINTLIINAAECEPYITADDRLMRERASDIVEGIRVLRHWLDPARTLIGIEDNKPEAITALRAALAGDDGVALNIVPTRYPSGGEKQLIQLLTGQEIATGTLPAEAGILCQNVATVYAIKRALIDGEPLISRITTVTGEAVARPGNYDILLGTPVADLLRHAGLDEQRLGRLVIGGPMMGVTLHDTTVPLVKTSHCLIAASPQELPEPAPEQACIRCGACAEACPAGLLPQQLYWHAKSGDVERAQRHHLMDCIECGACTYVCPSHIPLVRYYRGAKEALRQREQEQARADHARARFEARQRRLEHRQAAREERRRARLAANRERPDQHPPPTVPAATTPAPEQRQQQLQALKAAYNRAHKQYKQAHAALERAQRDGQDNDALATMSERVEQLKGKANQTRDAVQVLMAQAKSDLGAESGKTLKTLKLDAARAEIALRRHEDLIAAGKDSADEDTLRQWETQRQQQEHRMHTTRQALTQALQAQGLMESE